MTGPSRSASCVDTLPAPPQPITLVELATCEDWQIQAATQRRDAIRSYLLVPKRQRNRALARERCAPLGMKVSNFYGLIQKWEAYGTLSCLVPQKSSGGRGGRRLDPVVEAIMRDAIEKDYLTLHRPTALAIHEQVVATCAREGIKPPCYATLLSRIDAVPEYERVRHRRGWHVARDRFRPKRQKMPEASRPLERVQIDHTVLDIFVVSDDRLTVLGRPVFTVVIDEYTRGVLGYYLGLEPPSQLTVALALQHAATPKRALLDAYGIDFDWPMYGVPEAIYVDNGKEFYGEGFLLGCLEYGIAPPDYRPKGMPHYGGMVESFFRSQGIGALRTKGYTGKDVVDRPPDADVSADKTLADLEEMILTWIAGVHSNKQKSGWRLPPRLAWERYYRGDEPQPLPDLLDDPNAFLIKFLPTRSASVQRYGIRLLWLDYWDETLVSVLRSGDTSCRNRLRWDPRDVGTIWFLEAGTSAYRPIPCSEHLPPGMTFRELREVRRQLYKEGKDRTCARTIAKAAHRLRKLAERSAHETAKAASRQERERKRREVAEEASPVRAFEQSQRATPPSEKQDSQVATDIVLDPNDLFELA